MIYELMQKNASLQEFCFENDFVNLSNNFLKNKEKNLTLRVQFRMDPPTDRNKLYDWHQDSAYENFNSKPSNGVILWTPLSFKDYALIAAVGINANLLLLCLLKALSKVSYFLL